MKFEPNDVIDERYRVVSILGSGASGIVYLCEDVLLKRQMAVKVLGSDISAKSEKGERFQREAKLLSRLNHPNIVGIHRYGFLSDGSPFIVLDYVDGSSLRALLEREKQLNLQDAAEIVRQVCVGLKAANENGIVHRDLKPENILVTADEYRKLVKIIDFGLGKQIIQDPDSKQTQGLVLTRTGASMGTLAYMSPEQRVGNPLDWRTDIYALGCIFFEMLTGSSPSAANTATADLSLPRISETYGVRDKTALAIDEFLQKCCAIIAVDRFASHDALLAALTELTATDPEWSLTVARKTGRSFSPAKLFLLGTICICSILLLLNALPLLGPAKPKTAEDWKLRLEQKANSGTLDPATVDDAREFLRNCHFQSATDRRRFEFSIYESLRDKLRSDPRFATSLTLFGTEVLRSVTKEAKDCALRKEKCPKDFGASVDTVCIDILNEKHGPKIWSKIAEATNEYSARVGEIDILSVSVITPYLFFLRGEALVHSGASTLTGKRDAARNYNGGLQRLYGAITLNQPEKPAQMKVFRQYLERLIETSQPKFSYGLFYGYLHLTNYYLQQVWSETNADQKRKLFAEAEKALAHCSNLVHTGGLGIEDYEFIEFEKLLRDVSSTAYDQMNAHPKNIKEIEKLDQYASDFLFVVPELRRIALGQLERTTEASPDAKLAIRQKFEHDEIATGALWDVDNIGTFYSSLFHGHAFKFIVLSKKGDKSAADKEFLLATHAAKNAGSQSEQFLGFLKAAKGS